MRDDKTEKRQYPLPHPDNYLEDDVKRIRQALRAIDKDISKPALLGNVGTRAYLPNTIADVEGMLGRTPSAGDYAKILKDAWHGGAMTENYIMDVNTAGTAAILGWYSMTDQNWGEAPHLKFDTVAKFIDFGFIEPRVGDVIIGHYPGIPGNTAEPPRWARYMIHGLPEDGTIGWSGWDNYDFEPDTPEFKITARPEIQWDNEVIINKPVTIETLRKAGVTPPRSLETHINPEIAYDNIFRELKYGTKIITNGGQWGTEFGWVDYVISVTDGYKSMFLTHNSIILAPWDAEDVKLINVYAHSVTTEELSDEFKNISGKFCGVCQDANSLSDMVSLVPYNAPQIGFLRSTGVWGVRVMENMRTDLLSGLRKFKGGISGFGHYPNVFIPFDHPYVGLVPQFEPYKNGALIEPAGHSKFSGGAIMRNGKILFVPYNHPFVGIYDPINDVYTNGPSVEDCNQEVAHFDGAIALSDGRVILVPASRQGEESEKAFTIGIYDPYSNTLEKRLVANPYGFSAMPQYDLFAGGTVVYEPDNNGNIVELVYFVKPNGLTGNHSLFTYNVATGSVGQGAGIGPGNRILTAFTGARYVCPVSSQTGVGYLTGAGNTVHPSVARHPIFNTF